MKGPAAPPKVLADTMAKGLQWATIPPVDWLGLDATYVMRYGEAQAIAGPLSRLMWPYLRQLDMLQRALAKVDEGSEAYLLIKALWAYVERVGLAAFSQYMQRVELVRSQRAAARAQSQQSGREAGGSSGIVQQTGPLRGHGATSGRSAGRGPGAMAAPGGPGAGYVGSSIGPDGVIGDRIQFNGGPFGAVALDPGAPPVAYLEPEAWSLPPA